MVLLAPAGVQLPPKSTRASTRISAEVLWAWGDFTKDSDDDWQEDLITLVTEAQAKGFISLSDTMEETAEYLGRWPVLNKLGFIVKVKGDKRKARLIWDFRESGANGLCSQGERIMLPRAFSC